MQQTPWFDRSFPPIPDNGLFAPILERLEGTPARLYRKVSGVVADLAQPQGGKWSIKKEIGHLLDLEPLWYERILQIIGGQQNLKAADLSNTQTHQADHDQKEATALIKAFEAERAKMVALLRTTTAEDLEKFALHPRLGTRMHLIDLAFFVAEHDDHHLAHIHHALVGSSSTNLKVGEQAIKQ